MTNRTSSKGAKVHAQLVGCMLAFGPMAMPATSLAEPPPEPDTAHEIQEHRREASEHASQAREHAAEAMKHHREEARAKFKELREATREEREAVHEELKQAGATAREQLKQAGEQLKAAGLSAREQLKGAREALHEGIVAGKAELQVAGEKFNQEFAVLRERAEEARARVWAQWKTKLRSREAIDARIQREFEKHARREAKLRRIESVARDAGDSEALDRVARLKAREDDRHALRMRKLTEDLQAAEPSSGGKIKL